MERTGSIPLSLSRALADQGLGSGDWVLLPGGRVNHCWKLGQVVVKLFRPEADTPLFRNDPGAEYPALKAFSSLNLAPKPTARGDHEGQHWIAMEALDGTEPKDADGARALARLHREEPLAGLPVLSGSKLTEQCDEMIASLSPEYAAQLAAPRLDCPDLPTQAQLHGDPVLANMVQTARGVRLIDWQCPAIGDPAIDLSVFLSPGMRRLYGGDTLTGQALDDVLTAYGDRTLIETYHIAAPFLHWRIAVYCAWMAERGWPGYAEAFAEEVAWLDTI